MNGGQLYDATTMAADGNYYGNGDKVTQAVSKVDTQIGKVASGDYIAIDEGNTVSKNLEALDKAIQDIEFDGVDIIKGVRMSEDKAASATGAQSTAVGYNTVASGEGATAIGYGNKVSGAQSTAVGYKNEVSGANSGAFGDPNVVTGSGSYAIGNNNTINGNNNFVLGNSVTVAATVENSVALGNGSTVTESNVVSVGNETEGGQRRIVNVAAGQNATDAANVGQLLSVKQDMATVQNQMASVSGEVKEVGAMSAALAGLHYVEPTGEGDDKFTGAVAYGGYRGENAAAVGIAYKPNANLMVSASTSVSNNQNMYNAGVGFKFGKGNTAATKASLQKQVKYLNDKNGELADRLDNANTKIEQVSDENGKLKETLNEVLKRLEKLEKKKAQ